MDNQKYNSVPEMVAAEILKTKKISQRDEEGFEADEKKSTS